MNQKKRRNRKLQIILIGCLSVFGIIGYSVYWLFFDMERLPTGEYLTEATSPDGTYTLKAYLANGGATTAYSIRGELIFNTKDKKKKNIYWNYREETAEIEWTDNDRVVINGHTLHVPKDKFDFRRQDSN